MTSYVLTLGCIWHAGSYARVCLTSHVHAPGECESLGVVQAFHKTSRLRDAISLKWLYYLSNDFRV